MPISWKSSQLIVYHFMSVPMMTKGVCTARSGPTIQRRQSSPAASRCELCGHFSGPAFQDRAVQTADGLDFKWLSSFKSDFNFDYQAPLPPRKLKNGTAFYNYARTDPGMMDREGISVFYQDESGAIFHTYSCYARGIDMMNATYQYLDLVPKGRDEQDLEDPQAWVRYRDRYLDKCMDTDLGAAAPSCSFTNYQGR